MGSARRARRTGSSRGTPRAWCSTFARALFIRVPRPAASTTAWVLAAMGTEDVSTRRRTARRRARSAGLGVDEVDERVLVTDRIEVGIALRERPVARAGGDGALERLQRRGRVARPRRGRGQAVEHVLVLRVHLLGLTEELQGLLEL